MTVGVLAHLFGKLPYRELAAKVGEAGFTHVQLAPWRAISDVDFNKPGKFNPGLALSIAEEFRKHGVSISVLGCYLHFFVQDEELLRENVERFKELIRYASLLGAPMVAAEVGRNEDGTPYSERDWRVVKEVVRELADEAEKWGVFVGLEAANDHLVGTAAELATFLEEVPSSHIGVVIDPGNLLKTENLARQDEIIREAFQLLGPRIIAAHAKDRRLSSSGEIETVPPGFGDMNYALYMELLEQYKPGVHIIMEAAQEHEMAQSKRYIEGHRIAAQKAQQVQLKS
ncbi:sugar phosphate isomerase/epimerase family protein [Paenibacillus polymyxa]|uniref:sugar phosphate isomerase/epimerase family protein n=3 Tax=Paenibacillus TaxID=44249 RepID=UPI000DA058E3|nr:sugar phosphate isomerase/epimerase [Paenibacillus polymyxa]MCJ1222053.1 sugar phosphate isomerase/epimerase [Paenibacillus polymyxa]MDU8676010.1 sugar phosphate isomerase/epimerase [Paenibacillus polymyxa]MDU8700920.1 sugar phosphate isomerase/epimerase [Paenibacillus polymyxa]URJ34049.1 sugar phosphate isomerase/epimerase [Paenibacillus polymyxa]URJ58012.1 sugar phosphate isomerase/epimerase [Paenibacillus polymyxa]